jgi:hypothetical protein
MRYSKIASSESLSSLMSSVEKIYSMVGSFGLVSVAPFTALCEGFMLPKKK